MLIEAIQYSATVCICLFAVALGLTLITTGLLAIVEDQTKGVK